MKKCVVLLFNFLLIFPYALQAVSTDFVVYSFDRPLQLYALLESIERYVSGLNVTQVIYRASDDAFAHAYDEVFARFGWATPLKQGAKPYEDFKPLVLKATFESPSVYVVFAVDDMVVKDTIDLDECCAALEQTQAYGFYLRLGRTLTQCYMLNREQRVPPLKRVKNDIYQWRFADGECDWGYPNTTDMTLYRKKDLGGIYYSRSYHSPNMLESVWSAVAHLVRDKTGLCYAQSKAVALPINLVQKDFTHNRYMHGYSVQELLTIFNQGLKLDITPLHMIQNKAAHMDYEMTFVARP